MSKQTRSLLRVCASVALTAALAASASADVYVAENIAFNANGKNPWGPGDALEVGDRFTLLDIPLNPPPPNINVDVGPYNANPVDIALQALSDALGVPLPDSLVSLKLGGSASGNAHLGFEYFASLGRLNVTYPASSSLNVQTVPGGEYLQSNQPSNIGSTFEPGVTQREVPRFRAIEIGGAGYGEPVYGGLDFTDYSTPKFTTEAPKAMAKLTLTADVRAGLYTEVSALFGLKTWRKNFNFGGPVGGPLIEINPSGLYLAGEDTGLFDLTDPIDVPLGFGNARVTYPQLGLTGVPTAPNSHVLRGERVSEVFRVDADLEKLIPLVGPFLSGSLAGIEYDLLSVTGGPVVSIYQDQTFTPHPRVRLQFSEPVLIRGSDNQYHQASQTEFALGQPLDWEPMFSNSSEITIVPTYILNNTFRNQTGIDIAVEVDLDAIGFDAPFLPNYVGPLINPDPLNLSLGRINLYDEEWEIELGDIPGDEITIPKFNVEQVFNVGDLRLLSRELVSGTEGAGDVTYVLNFNRDVVGGPPIEYQATVAGVGSLLQVPVGDEYDEVGMFEANEDVVLTDLVLGKTYNVGRNFSLYNWDLTPTLPDAGPAFIAEDPNNPGQFLPPLYVTTLPDIPDTSVDVPNHPILGGPDTSNVNDVVEEEFGTEVIDLRTGPETTILAQSIHFAPEGDARLGMLKPGFPSINNSGQTTIHSLLETFTPDAYYDNPPALYLADESGVKKLVRVGDPAPGGGTIETSNELAFSQANQVNESGQTAFLSRDFVLYRAGPNEVVEIARPLQAPPEGGGTFAYIYDPAAINDSGQVAFQALVADSVTQEVALYRGDGNTLTKIARQGDPLPGMNAPLTFFASFALNNSGKVAFTAANAGGEVGVYLGNGSSLVTIGVAGGVAPNGGMFDEIFGSAAVNNVDQVAFLAQVAPSPGGNPLLGLFRSDGVETAQIAWLGQPLGQGATLSGIFNHYLNDQGQVAFLAFAASAGSEYRAVFMGDENGLLEISRAGLSAPDGNGVFVGFSHEGVFDGLAFNNEGHMAFEARLTQTVGGTSDDDGIFLYDGTNVIQVVREGQALAGSTVVSIAELVAQGLTYGGPLNDDMQLAYTVALADGREIVARFEPSLYWRNPGSGTWGMGDNWSLGVEPAAPYDLFIVAENALTVTGPAVNRTVKSLTLGGEDTASAALNLTSGVTLTAVTGTTIHANGILSGYGAMAGDVASSGTIRAGGIGAAAKTTMLLDGDVTLDIGSKLELDMAGTEPGTQFDRFAITGAAHLDGELAASLVSYVPALGRTFQILTAAGGISGQFDMTVTQLPTLAAGSGWLIRYNSNEVTLQVIPKLVGDFSANGIVGPEDLEVLTANFGSTTNLSADADGDLDVDGGDFLIWQRRLGTSSPFAPSANVPEPGTWMLALMGVLAFRSRRFADDSWG